MKGYIKLHRTILDWEWYKDTNTKILFIHLLLNACYDSCRFMGKAVKRGDYITSITRLSHDLGLTVRQVRTCLSRLKKTGEIDIQTSNRYTMITICNYEGYQVKEVKEKPKKTRKRQANDTQTTKINKKEIKKEYKNNNNYFETSCKDNIWIESVCMNYTMSKPILLKALEKFNNHLDMTEDYKLNMKNYKTHFINWLRYNKDDVVKESNKKYSWKWKGQAVKSGSLTDMNKDKAKFDKQGFEFKIIANGN